MVFLRRIAHLDMDAFFASVELLHYPMLRGQAVVVGGRSVMRPQQLADGSWQFACLRDYVGRGVVTTATYEAREFGVHSGMGLMKAAQKAPDAVLLPANFEAYRDFSRRFKAAVAGVAPVIEDRGIDEIYIDLTDFTEDSVSLARRIKAAVRAATGLSCSIGITPNKLLAKIASDLDKPDGICVLSAEDVPTRIWPLPVRRINGIGPKAGARLQTMGVNTVGELAAVAESVLVAEFGGSMGRWLYRAARGIDERPLETVRASKSVSRETTFERDLDVLRDRVVLTGILDDLCVRLEDDLRKKDLLARTIGIKLRFADFTSVTRDITLPAAVGSAREIRQAARQCLKRIIFEQRMRLLGVRASGQQARVPVMTQGDQGELPL